MVKFTESKLKLELMKYKEFGKFIINMQLLQSNVLLVKYKSYAPIPGLKRTNISNDLKLMINYLFDTGEIDYQSGQKLTSNEKDIFNKLIVKSGLNLQLKFDMLKMEEDESDVINEFNILKGEILAGNDNPKIKQDIKDVLQKLVRLNKISQLNAEQIIIDLE